MQNRDFAKVLSAVSCLIVGMNLSDARAEDLEWVRQIGSTETAGVHALAVSSSGETYTTGFFRGIVDFDPGPGTVHRTSVGRLDGFLSKLDSNGNFVWVAQFGGPGAQTVSDVTLDGQDHVYISGSFEDTVDFDPGPGTVFRTSAGYSDLFVAQLDTAGNLNWVAQVSGPRHVGAAEVALDPNGNIYVPGSFFETVDFDPGPGTFSMTSAGEADGFVLKLNPLGEFLWAVQLAGAEFDRFHRVGFDGSGHVYSSGIFQGTADFDPGPGTISRSATGTGSDGVTRQIIQR